MKPAHEEDTQGQAVCDQDQRGVVSEPAGIDVSDHVVLKDGHSIVDIRPRLAVGEAVEEASETQALRLLVLLSLGILQG